MKHHYVPQFYLRPWLGPDNKLTSSAAFISHVTRSRG